MYSTSCHWSAVSVDLSSGEPTDDDNISSLIYNTHSDNVFHSCIITTTTTTTTNNNNNNGIFIVPYGRNFRGAAGRSDQCSVKAWLNKKVLSQDLKTRVADEHCLWQRVKIGKHVWKKSVLVNGWTSSGMADECKVWLQTHSMIRSFRYIGVEMLRT